MKLDTLEKLYIHELKDLWSAEGQLVDVFPQVVKTARDEHLAGALKKHFEETRTQQDRIERIFESLEYEPGGHRCRAMAGLISEMKDVLGGEVADSVVDAALVAGLQRIEHYEIAGYGVARTFAEKLGRYADADLLQLSLNEEGLTDQKLTLLAERSLNFEALSDVG